MPSGINSPLSKRSKVFLLGSVVLSLVIHIAEMHFLQRQSLWFSSPTVSDGSQTHWISTMEKMGKDQILKQTFEILFVQKKEGENKGNTSGFSQKTPHLETAAEENLILSIETIPFEKKRSNPALPSQILASTNLLNGKAQKVTFSPLAQIDIAYQLPRESLPAYLNQEAHLFSPRLEPIDLTDMKMGANFELPKSFSLLKHSDFLKASAWEPKRSIFKTKTPKTPSLPKIPSLMELQTHPHSNSFDTELVYFEKEDGTYIFALTLIAREDLQLPPLKQNYLFLIDRSNSIQGERLAATKNAVRKAIEEIGPDDHFNIIAFDQKIDKLSPSFLSSSPDSFAKAHSFLNKIELGSFFSQANLYKPLFLTIPSFSDENELFTAILITDSENLGDKNSTQSLLNEWTLINDGKVALYALGMNDDAHLQSLNTIASFNRGKSVSSPTKRGLKRKLLKLMKSIHTPLAKNIVCKAVSRSPQTTIELLPADNLAPHLFLNEPYVILGTAASTDDFVLFVQGRLNGEWLHIKKNISFSSAKKGGSSLQEEWVLSQANSLYRQYLKKNDVHLLAEAKTLLKIHDLQGIFE